ncbi:MAG TPA: NADH-quinone oxidoreductase subunit J [Gemmatimonadales bacterium]|nr:NADH-quinone oxidoreductase subunit J [Gemmatimonadales bacterium]
MTETVFYVFAGMAVLSAVLCILQRNPVAAVLWLVSTMLALAGIYVLLGARFIGAIQVLVYAGAVMVLFLFVIMLLNLGHARPDIRGWPTWVVGAALLAVLVANLLVLRRYSPERVALEYSRSVEFADPRLVFPEARPSLAAADTNVVHGVAAPMFQTWLVPFEITSVLLLAAIVGAVVLAKRRI